MTSPVVTVAAAVVAGKTGTAKGSNGLKGRLAWIFRQAGLFKIQDLKRHGRTQVHPCLFFNLLLHAKPAQPA